MLKIKFQGRFKKDYQQSIRRGCDPKRLMQVITLLADQQPLPPNYKDHALKDSKRCKGMRECHIQPDWLLVYQIDQEMLLLRLIRTGTHSDLFE